MLINAIQRKHYEEIFQNIEDNLREVNSMLVRESRVDPLTQIANRRFFDDKIESEFRRALNYPPFGRLVNLRLDGPKPAEVEKQAQALAAKLRALQARTPSYREHVEVLGPAPAPIDKLRNRYRWQLLLRSKQSALLLSFARQAREALRRAPNVRLHIDVDPYSML